MPSSFYINHAKFQRYADLSLDFFLKRTKFKKGSYERQICDIKKEMFWKEAKKYLKKAQKEAERKLNEQI